MLQKLRSIVTLTATPREPPKELLLLPFGRIQTRKGEFCLTPEGANQILMKWKEHGVDLALDYEHGMVESNGQPAPAAGWAQLDLRDDGIWMTNIKWTDRAAEHLRAGEYRYLSPAFTADKDSHEILELINVAMTNLPATDNIAPLVAANRNLFDYDLDALPDEVELVVKKEGGRWVLYDSSGKKKLGTHDTKAEAQAQESAIDISKARAAGHNIPQKNTLANDGVPAHLLLYACSVELGGVLQGGRGGVKNASNATACIFLAQHFKETHMTFREHLAQYTAAHKDLTVAALCAGLGIDTEKLVALAKGAVPSQEEMKKMAKSAKSAKLDIFQGDFEQAEIDASINGGDVNDGGLIGEDDSASSIFDSTTTSSDESHEQRRMALPSSKSAPTKPAFIKQTGNPGARSGGEVPNPALGSPDEASESQGDNDLPKAIGMHMKNEQRLREIMTLTGAKNEDEAQGVLLAWRETAARAETVEAEVTKLKAERDANERAVLVEQGKKDGKLTPSLIKLFAGKSNEEFRAFLSVAPAAVGRDGVSLREISPAGAGGGIDLTPDEAFIEQLIPGDPKMTLSMRKTLEVTLKGGAAAIAYTGDSQEYNLSIMGAFTAPATEPNGWLPRSALRPR